MLIFFAIDMVWLGLVAPEFYQHHLSHILAEDVFWPAAIAFYLLFISGLLVFAVKPALKNGSVKHGLKYGGLFGLYTYATYDLTNYATIEGWPLIVVAVDICWGIILCGSVAGLSSMVGMRLKRHHQ
jgi:uncharacterized membrane protein